MPPSIKENTGDQLLWLRPKEYLFELALEIETKKLKAENRNIIKKIKASKSKLRTSSIGSNTSVIVEEEVKK